MFVYQHTQDKKFVFSKTAMLLTTSFAILMGFWASLYLVDIFFKTYWPHQYLNFLEWSGLVSHICQVQWYSQSLNDFFIKAGKWNTNLLRKWFNAGAVLTVGMMGASVTLLVITLKNALMASNTVSDPADATVVLQPVMPGVNLPISQIAYYLLTLLLCGVLHELGHAIAAARENVKINGFGMFLFLIYPGAFVDLYTDHLQGISAVRRLRIYCAGVWHNMVIVAMAMLVLFSMPVLLFPGYVTGDAIVVTHIEDYSPVAGAGGLIIGSKVTSINGCAVTNIASWNSCISNSIQMPDHGYCVPKEHVQSRDGATAVYVSAAGNVECCSNSSLASKLCFSYETNEEEKGSLQYTCLTARIVTAMPPCRIVSECYSYGTGVVCAYPSLDNTTRLLRIVQQDRDPVLFVGHPGVLPYSVSVSDFAPRFFFVPVTFPYMLETFCKYLISLSGALAVLNVVPCYALDGQWILLALVEIICRGHQRQNGVQSLIYSVILLLGTVLLGCNIITALWQLLIK